LCFPSDIAWPILRDMTDQYLAIVDQYAEQAASLLYMDDIKSSNSGAAGIGGLLSMIATSLAPDSNSNILCINTEGESDTIEYNRLSQQYPNLFNDNKLIH